LLEYAPPKGPIIKLPAGTKILLLKHNETLVGVKTNKSDKIVCAKYNTGERTYCKVKFMPPKDAPKRTLAASETPHKRHRTIANLDKEFEAQHATISSIEASLRL